MKHSHAVWKKTDCESASQCETKKTCESFPVFDWRTMLSVNSDPQCEKKTKRSVWFQLLSVKTKTRRSVWIQLPSVKTKTRYSVWTQLLRVKQKPLNVNQFLSVNQLLSVNQNLSMNQHLKVNQFLNVKALKYVIFVCAKCLLTNRESEVSEALVRI